MITFNNFQNNQHGQVINITIPRHSLVYLKHDINFLKKPYRGEILFENFPIHHAQKTFYKKYFTQIEIGHSFNKNLTLAENMKFFAHILNSSCIWSLPLVFLEIPHKLWNVKTQKIAQEDITKCEYGILLFCRENICYINNTQPTHLIDKIQEIIKSKVTHGNEIIFYRGFDIMNDESYKIIL